MANQLLEAKRQELAQLTAQLDQHLGQGLLARLQHPSWYLTGVKVGLQSLQAYYEISELVYREHTARTEGGRRLGNLRNVYNRLSQFAGANLNAGQRAAIMLELRQPLQTLLREFQGWDTGAADMRQRKTIISQLAADIRMALIRVRSFEKMHRDLASLQSPKFWVAKGAKRKAAERVRHDHIGYAGEFGFANAEVLLDGQVVRNTIQKVEREIKKLEQQLKLVHHKIYSDRHKQQASGDLKADLAENRTLPILQTLSKAGFEYLNRAHSIYEHALQLLGGDTTLFKRVSQLGAEIEEQEIAAADPKRARSVPPSTPR